jgi:hypothetical protein
MPVRLCPALLYARPALPAIAATPWLNLAYFDPLAIAAARLSACGYPKVSFRFPPGRDGRAATGHSRAGMGMGMVNLRGYE